MSWMTKNACRCKHGSLIHKKADVNPKRECFALGCICMGYASAGLPAAPIGEVNLDNQTTRSPSEHEGDGIGGAHAR